MFTRDDFDTESEYAIYNRIRAFDRNASVMFTETAWGFEIDIVTDYIDIICTALGELGRVEVEEVDIDNYTINIYTEGILSWLPIRPKE